MINSSNKNPLLLFLILLMAVSMFFQSAPTRADTGDTFRLIFVGSLSGYVKICG